MGPLIGCYICKEESRKESVVRGYYFYNGLNLVDLGKLAAFPKLRLKLPKFLVGS
jgi:hypothetical protein